MKHIYKSSLFIAFLVVFYPFFSVFAAITPTFALANGNNSIVSISVNADPNASVMLYYYPNNASNTSTTNIGTTDGSGNLNTTLNASNYNIQSGSSVYIVVNGQQSQTRTWPYYNNNGNYGGNIYLSQNNVTINSLGSATVNVNGGNGNGYYISSNSNSSVVSAYVSGNTINLSGNGSGGSSTILVCGNGSGNANCATLYVTISNNNYNNNGNPINVNPSSISLGVGQSANVTVYGGNNYYYLSSGTNSYIVNASVNGNSISLYGRNPGSETLVVCSSNISSGNNYNYSSCANLYVTVGGSYNYNYGNNTNYYNTPTIGTSASGVYLSQIPYTGVGENIKMILFILGMMIWSGFMAYAFMLKRGMLQPAGHPKMSMSERIQEFKKENLRRKGNK